MVKKRRDKERDPSSAKKIAKLGGTALAVGAGAVFFNRSNIGMKMHSEIMPALSKAHKGVRNELKGKKLSAKLIDDAFEELDNVVQELDSRKKEYDNRLSQIEE